MDIAGNYDLDAVVVSELNLCKMKFVVADERQINLVVAKYE